MNTQIGRILKIKTQTCQIIPDFLALNPKQSIMVLGQGKQIKVFNFGGTLKLLRKSKQKSYALHCIVFSKKYNWFASANLNYQIQVWKLLPNGEWEGSKPQVHQSRISCLILNKDENQLISCSYDKSIIVWQINYEINEIVYDYALEKRHTHIINSISINQSESFLLSFSQDQTIILWRNVNNKWIYQSEIQHSSIYYHQKLLLFSDYEFALLHYAFEIIHIFEIRNNQMIMRQKQNLNLSVKEGSFHLFIPSLFNTGKGIIIHFFEQFILILLKKKDDLLELTQNPIDLIHKNGAITKNGDYFIAQAQFICKIYKIQYQ